MMTGEEPDTGGSSEGLDRRILGIWALHLVVRTLVLLVLAGMGGLALVRAGAVPGWVVPAGVAALAAGLLVGQGWLVRARFRRWRYALDESRFRLCHGVIVRREIDVPLSRVQHVDIEEGILERRRGLARLVLFTAGTREARQEVPGLAAETARALRDRLLAHRELLNPPSVDE